MSKVITTVTEYEEKALELIAKVQDDVLGYVKQAVEFVDGRISDIELPFELPEVAVLDELPDPLRGRRHPVRLLEEAPRQPGEVRQERRQGRSSPSPVRPPRRPPRRRPPPRPPESSLPREHRSEDPGHERRSGAARAGVSAAVVCVRRLTAAFWAT